MSLEVTSVEKQIIVQQNGLYFRVDEIISEGKLFKFRCGAVRKGSGRWHKISPRISLAAKL